MTRLSINRTAFSPFKQHEINPEASFADLMVCCFEHCGAQYGDFSSAISCIIEDNLAVIQALASHDACGNANLIAGLALRTEYLLRVGPELERRMREAEEQADRQAIRVQLGSTGKPALSLVESVPS